MWWRVLIKKRTIQFPFSPIKAKGLDSFAQRAPHADGGRLVILYKSKCQQFYIN